MKKYLTLEVLVEDTVDDWRECVEEVINEAIGHEYCCDGTVKISIIGMDSI